MLVYKSELLNEDEEENFSNNDNIIEDNSSH